MLTNSFYCWAIYGSANAFPLGANTPTDMAQLLTVEDVAKRTGLSVDTLNQWRSQKRHFAYVKIGRRVFYLATDVEEYIGKCRVSVPPDRRRK